MTDTTTYVTEAKAKVWAILQELRDGGAKVARLDLATRVHSDLVDLEGCGGGIDPDEMRETLERLSQHLAGGRSALAMRDAKDPLWDGLENAIDPLITHLLHAEMYGND